MDVVDRRIERILAAAGRAPSVHNSQPWTVDIQGTRITVRADPARQLRHVDPTGREMFVSCGAFLFNLRAAARRESLTAVSSPCRDTGDRLLVGAVTLEAGPEPLRDELDLADAIELRETARGPFDDDPLDADVVDDMQDAAQREGAHLHVISPWDRGRAGVLALVQQSEALAAQDDVAREEESSWSTLSVLRRDGVPVQMLDPADADGRRRVRRAWTVHAGGAGHPEDRTTMAVLTTAGDGREDWVAAGQSLEHVLLVATTFFVRASFHTTVLENPTTRHDLRRSLGLEGAPQMLMRLGYVGPHRRTPRRSVADIVTRHSDPHA